MKPAFAEKDSGFNGHNTAANAPPAHVAVCYRCQLWVWMRATNARANAAALLSLRTARIVSFPATGKVAFRQRETHAINASNTRHCGPDSIS